MSNDKVLDFYRKENREDGLNVCYRGVYFLRILLMMLLVVRGIADASSLMP